MKAPKHKVAAGPVDLAAVERLLADSKGAAQAPPDVATAAVAAALSKSLPAPLWALSKHESREVVKGARRALHLLRSRGVDVGGPPATPAAKVALVMPEAPSEPCRVTAVDGFGDRALWVPQKRVQGFEFWELILSDETGVRELHRVELSRKQLRAHFDSLPKGGTGVHEVSRARAAGLLAEAIALGGGPSEVTQARELLERLGGASAVPRTAPSPTTPQAAQADAVQRLGESAALFDEPELRSFVPPEPLLRELGAKFDEIDVSPLLLDERQKSGRRQHVIDQAVEGYFTPERRARYARRLAELAELWTAEGRADAASRAAAAARHLEGSAPIFENPFARKMFQRIFGELPAGAAEEAPEPQEPSAGGLIVPG